MSAMAGALNVRLEKPGYYMLGDNIVAISPKHILRALQIMKLTAYLFGVLITAPLLILVTMIMK
jgi:cobalamin biosynthesis protein CobD/CbiB